MKTNHIAFLCRGSAEWAIKKKKPVREGYLKAFENILELMKLQIKKNIPIMTFYVTPLSIERPDEYSVLIDEINLFFESLIKNDFIHKNKIKVSILGKWYNLPAKSIETIKNMIDSTKDYDSYFANFCISYDGQEEIVDSCKMIGRRIKLGKFDADSITKDTIKEDLYSSYFMPPNLIFVSGKKCTMDGFLLWDSVNSEIIFLKKNFPEVKISNILK